jgi:hypothetical protein
MIKKNLIMYKSIDKEIDILIKKLKVDDYTDVITLYHYHFKNEDLKNEIIRILSRYRTEKIKKILEND